MTPQNVLDLSKARFNMIEQQIRPWEVLDQDVLALLDRLPRDTFVQPAHKALAYADLELPLSAPAVEGECMLAPKVEARMLQDLAIKPTDRVLEVGTGSGYMAALLASRAARLVSLEINEALAVQARENLQRAGILNAEVRVADAAADGFAACAADGSWDVIVLSGSVAEVPDALVSLLAPGGRIGAITGVEPVMRATFITREGEASFRTTQPWDINAPRLRNFPEAPRFHF